MDRIAASLPTTPWCRRRRASRGCRSNEMGRRRSRRFSLPITSSARSRLAPSQLRYMDEAAAAAALLAEADAMLANDTGPLHLAAALGRPVVAGSDTHQSFQYGCAYNVFDREVNTVSGLMEEIRQGSYRIATSQNLEFQVETAGILKRALKTIHALGGDYVEVLIQGAEI